MPAPRIKTVAGVSVVLLWVCLHAATAGCDLLVIDENKQYEFADHLYAIGLFRRSAEEFQRFAFFFPNSSRNRTAIFKAGMGLFQAKDYTASIEQFNLLIKNDHLDIEARNAFIMLAESYLQLESPTQAIVQLHNLISLSDLPEIHDEAYYRLGWIHIGHNDWMSAKRAFNAISDKNRYPLERLNRALDDSAQIPYKNPTLAGTLSILPGGGQFYCERYQDALVAFLLNTALILSAVDAYHQDQYALGGVLTFVGFGFYAGNIYGAVSGAHKYNARETQRFKERIRQQISLNIGPASSSEAAFDGLAITVSIPF